MAKGKVKWFDNRKGFGFIDPDSGGPSVFVHHLSLLGSGYKTLNEDDKVEFDIIQSEKGPKAANVLRLTDAAAEKAKAVAEALSAITEVSPPAFVVAWDPDVIDPEDYAELVEALGNLVRAKGGLGVKPINSSALGVTVEDEVFV